MRRGLTEVAQSSIDEAQIFPRKGKLYQLEGPGHSGKSMRNLAEVWTAITLINGGYVHWIDGACRFNPARIINNFPSDLPDSEKLLHGLFVGRGFTVHQFAHLIERLQSEVKITRAQLIIIDAPISMHLDSQITDYEARSLFRKSIDILASLAEKRKISVVVTTSSKPYSKRHLNLLTMVKNRRHASLLGRVRQIQGKKRMWLLHLPSRHSGYRLGATRQENLYESISRVINSRLSIEGFEEIE